MSLSAVVSKRRQTDSFANISQYRKALLCGIEILCLVLYQLEILVWSRRNMTRLVWSAVDGQNEQVFNDSVVERAGDTGDIHSVVERAGDIHSVIQVIYILWYR